MSKTIEEILAPKPEAMPRIYAYSIDDAAHKGWCGWTCFRKISWPCSPTMSTCHRS